MQSYEKFEEIWSRNWANDRPVVGCSSGTAALHLALETIRSVRPMDLPAGAKVIVPDFGMVAVPRAVVLAGLEPVLVGCGDDLLLDLDAVDEAGACEDGISAILPVHTYGRRCDMEGISALARKYGWFVVEDLAEAHGVPPHPASDAACWSFYRNKIVAGEEGGAIAFRDDGLGIADVARSLRSMGFTEEHDFNHLPRGHNYRLSNSHAEMILYSTYHYTANLARRIAQVSAYDELCPPEWKMPPRDAPWVYDLRIRGLGKGMLDAVVTGLRNYGIEARHGFKPMRRQEEFSRCRHYGCNRTRVQSMEVLYLPLIGSSVEPEETFARLRGIVADVLGR